MKSTQLIFALFCCATIVSAACSADDATCEDPIMFETGNLYFKILVHSCIGLLYFGIFSKLWRDERSPRYHLRTAFY